MGSGMVVFGIRCHFGSSFLYQAACCSRVLLVFRPSTKHELFCLSPCPPYRESTPHPRCVRTHWLQLAKLKELRKDDIRLP